MAVKQQNEAVVEYLLEQRGLDISDCTLYAIKGGNIKIIEMIFDKIREVSPALEFAGTTHRCLSSNKRFRRLQSLESNKSYSFPFSAWTLRTI